MAIGKASDFKIYHEEFYGGMYEAIVQNVNAFNAASAGAIRLVARDVKGEYEKESFLKDISTFISRRDLTSVSAATDLAMTQDEFISVKVARKIGPIAQTLDAWRKIAEDQREMSFVVGGMIGERKMKDYLNTAIMCVEAAIDGQVALEYDATGLTTKTLIHDHMVKGLAKFGDQAENIICWVMHSKPYWNLVGTAISDKIDTVASATIYGGSPGTLGRPVVVTDSPSLWDLNTSLTDTYNVLGLVAGAVTVTESEQEEIVSETVTGLENLIFRIQGEYAFNVGVKGFQWDTGNGGVNPLDAAIATTTNWDKVATENKSLAGIKIIVQ
jgi:hypothetical protein